MYVFTPNTLIESAKINANNAELKAKTDLLITPDADWRKIGAANQPAFQNSWTNFDPPEINWSNAYFMKDAMGMVHLKGMVAGGTAGTTMFTLPVGYRPLKYHRWASISYDALANLEIQPDGDVYLVSGNGSWVNLGLLTFKAEQ